MFAKLLKNEFHATYKMMLLFSGLLLLTAVIAGLVLRFLVIPGMTETDTAFPIKALIGVLLIVAAMFAVMIYAVGSLIILVIRYYKSRFTDEGYLTFTLPATGRQIFLSSYVSNVIWSLVILLVFWTFFVIVALLGMMGTDAFSDLTEPDVSLPVGYAISQVVSIIICGLGSIMLVLTSVTIGAVVAKKHKILAAIGVYYGANVILGVVTSIMSLFLLFGEANLILTTLPQTIIYTIILIGGYFINIRLIDKKLNLP